MRVCVVGSGGREHALAVALAKTASVVVAPGNPGMCLPDGTPIERSAAAPEDIAADLFVIGPEVPLVGGLADRLRSMGKAVLGPGAEGAKLEGSKAWMKEVLASAGVPTAAHATFTDPAPAIEYLRSLPGPWIVKTDGLAAGKGVLVTQELAEAEADVLAKLSGESFGAAGRQVVIEEALFGSELSVMALCDGKDAVALAAAQDFKRVGDGDAGPNTGGMGAYSPVPLATTSVVDQVMDSAVRPTLDALSARGIDYRGVLYAGVMLGAQGPKILEFNVRFGDPETQVVLPRWGGDVAQTLLAAANGELAGARPEFIDDAAVCVVLAAPGYPDKPVTGAVIEGIDKAAGEPGVHVYAAGVAESADGRGLVTAGGRVLAVTATASDVSAARRKAYDAASMISWPGLVMRHDIASSIDQVRS